MQNPRRLAVLLTLCLPLAALAIGRSAAPARQPEEPPSHAPARSQAPADLADLARAARTHADVPALAIAIATPDGQISTACDGVRVMGEDDRVTDDDLWHLGSITKSMTATLAARLVEQGLITWDATIGERLGDLIPGMQEQYRDVTLAQLLAHRSGMPANIPGPRFREFREEPADPIADRLAWCRIALAMEPVGPSGQTFEYSNNGYVVAGAMLEAATGTSWQTLMQNEVFAPLGITTAGFGPPAGDTPTSQPRGHRPSSNGDRPAPPSADNPPALGPAGRVHMSLADLARYLHAHAVRDPDLLSPESYEFLHAPQEDGNYACGWVVITPASRWHNGSNTMWYAEAVFDTETNTAAAVAVNDGDIAGVQPTVRSTLRELMDRMKNPSAVTPAPATPAPVAHPGRSAPPSSPPDP